MKREENLVQVEKTPPGVIYTFLVYTMVHGCQKYAAAMGPFDSGRKVENPTTIS